MSAVSYRKLMAGKFYLAINFTIDERWFKNTF